MNPNPTNQENKQSETNHPIKIPPKIMGLILFLSAFEALAAVWYILQIPADLKNAVWLGLSAQRLGLIAFLLAGLGISLGLGFTCLRGKEKCTPLIERLLANHGWQRGSFALLALSALILWVLIFTPSDQAGRFQAYFERLQPVLAWLSLVVFQVLLYLNLAGRKIGQDGHARIKLWKSPAFWVMCFFLLVWIIMAATGLGIKPDDVHWNDAGAPLLVGQILAALTLGALTDGFTRWLTSRPNLREKKSFRWLDAAIALLIWAAAAIFWISEPLPHSFFAPGPYPPNYEPYPFSDAEGYDISAQFALIGQGLANKGYVDKPLYSGLLVLLHQLGGQSYFPVVNLQTILIAVLPALLYLMGKKIHSRGAGAAAAFLMVFRELNTIGATLWVLSTNSRVMMSEPLTMLGIGLFVFFLVLWGRAPRRDFHWLAAAGGTLGLTTLARHNPWLLIPAGLAFIFILEWRNWRRWLLGWLVFMLAFGAAISPWMIRNQVNNGKPFYFLVAFEGVVMMQRYNVRVFPNKPPPSSTLVPAQDNPETTPAAETTPLPEKAPSLIERIITRAFTFVPDHFFHNLLVTSAIFPSSPMLMDLENTIKEPGSIWDAGWDAQLSAIETIMMLLLLIILSIGLGAAWRRWRWTGVLPGLIFLSYNLATAAARTSGARYIQPADWAAYFFLSIGLIEVWNRTRQFLRGEVAKADDDLKNPGLPENIRTNPKWIFPWKSLLAGAIVFTITGMVALSEWVYPLRFPPITEAQLADVLIEDGWASRMGLTPEDLNRFLDSKDAILLRGRALYPRYYGIGSGEPDRFSAYRERPFPRLVITTIGQDEMRFGVLPLANSPEFFPNGADVIVLGCRDELNYELAAIIMTDPREILYSRSPESPLACPLREPVCDDNRNCR